MLSLIMLGHVKSCYPGLCYLRVMSCHVRSCYLGSCHPGSSYPYTPTIYMGYVRDIYDICKINYLSYRDATDKSSAYAEFP